MPPTGKVERHAVLRRVAEDCGLYPIEAFEFLQRGLAFTVHKIHGITQLPSTSRHVTGQQLCEGLREYALNQWGFLAMTVLSRWNITSTFDFGRIVFTLVRYHELATTERDSIEDFRNVYDFKQALEASYCIAARA